MSLRNTPGHVVRLAILVVVAVAVLVVVRQRFVPESFGETGHYRAVAVEIAADQQIRYGGQRACAECHDDVAETKSLSYHRGLTCEGCHGPASDHVSDPTEHRPIVPQGRDVCLRCHSYLASRPTGFPQIVENLHNPVTACAECHDPHDPTPPSTPDSCADCHAAIARVKAVSHHWALDCETCHSTPAEHMENPRANPPMKPTEREFCGGCHAPGAGGRQDAPRVDLGDHGGRYLCWQCHYPHFPEGRQGG